MIHTFPNNLQSFFTNQIKGLVDAGHDVSIFAKNKAKAEFPDFAQNNLKVFYNDLPEDQRKYDVIYCAMLSNLSQLKSIDVKGEMISGCHCYQRGKVDWAKMVKILSCCNYFKKRLVDLGCETERVEILNVGIDFSQFTFRERSPNRNGNIRLISVCRLSTIKGLENAIKAVAKLLKRHKNIEYHIVGGGAQLAKLNSLIRELGVGNKIKLLGEKPHDEVADLLDKAHMFIHPSITIQGGQDGMPTSIMEAMAVGLPVVGTYSGGIPELITDGVEGFLVKENDITALANRIEYLIKKPELWPVMGAAGRKKIEKYHCMKTENEHLSEFLYSCMNG